MVKGNVKVVTCIMGHAYIMRNIVSLMSRRFGAYAHICDVFSMMRIYKDHTRRGLLLQ